MTKKSSPSKTPISADDEVVISGMAGRYPLSNNLYELRDNLMEMHDLITETRWKTDISGAPDRQGRITNLEKFDAAYFGIDPKQADVMDPMGRMLLEHSYEAIMDAGVNPKQLRGTRTGVFIGLCLIGEKMNLEDEQDREFDVNGYSRALFANRISYCFDLRGPSMSVDAACSASLCALEQAYRAIKDGLCDAAIVGSSHTNLNPDVSWKFFKLGTLAKDGKCKAWDESANGYVRSEAVSVVLLQKAKDARRVYSTLLHAKMNCDGYKPEGMHAPKGLLQGALLKEVYAECGLPPSSLYYLEAHGTGTKAGDPQEIAGIDEALGRYRSKEDPLLIGSVKTNLGHAEPASGLASMTKIILAMESGVLPGNLHFRNCRQDLEAIMEGRLKVVTEPIPWKGQYAGISNFGFGGANGHAVLRINSKEKIDKGAPNDDLPRLVAVSGRTEGAVLSMLEDLESKPVDVEQLALLYNIYSDVIAGHPCRGYTILSPRGITKSPVREISPVDEIKRPVLFVFSGIGSQWPGMGRDLLRISAFCEAMQKCDSVLKPLGIDIIRVIADNDESTFDSVLNCVVGITAVQIGLVDVLRSLKIEPDYIIGHSMGEWACAYADGCLTAEQTIMSAYYLAVVSIETDFINGSTDAVGLGKDELQKLRPSDIVAASHDSPGNSTINGLTKSVNKSISELKSKDISARAIPCYDVPNCSKHVGAAGPRLVEHLKKVIPRPKLRSSSWFSTSVEMDKWSTDLAAYCSAEYYANNYLSPVLFNDALTVVPSDVIAIEVAPHGFLQSILNRSLPPTVTNISLMQRGGDEDGFTMLLGALGRMFNAGLQPQLDKLYPAVTFPVSRGTPMISPMIKWDHREDWYVNYFENLQVLGSNVRVVKINSKHRDYDTIVDHIADGRILIPATSYVTLIWETFALMKSQSYTEIPVVIENLKFLRAVPIPNEEGVELTLSIQRGTGSFEIMEGDTVVLTGLIRSFSSSEAADNEWELNSEECDGEESLSSRDVYRELNLRGYQYAAKFRNVTRAAENGCKAHVVWKHNWIIFLDSVLQLILLGKDTRETFLPTSIDKISIDPNRHKRYLVDGESEQEFEVFYDQLNGVVSTAGVRISGFKGRSIARKKFANEPVLEEYKFVPFMDETDGMSLLEIVKLAIDVAVENSTSVNIKTVELGEADNNLLSPWIVESLKDIPLIKADVIVLRTKDTLTVESVPESISVVDVGNTGGGASALLVMGQHLLLDDRDDGLNLLLRELKPDGFILTREDGTSNVEDLASVKGYHIIMKKRLGKEIFTLLRKKDIQDKDDLREMIVIKVHNDEFDWVETMRECLSEVVEKRKSGDTRVIFVGQGDSDNGLVGLINSLRKEPGGEIVRGILIQDPTAPPFSLESAVYSRQLEKDLALAVLRENGVWGSYRHLPLPAFEARPVHQFFLSQSIPGNLSSLEWTEGSLQPTCNDENLVNVAYASLNFKDIMMATGKLSLTLDEVTARANQGYKFGYEYSGTSTSGKRVMGLKKYIGNVCVADPCLMWQVPDEWSLEDAATVPCVYSTCVYALYVKGKMKKGDKVLIHAGAGGVGQAAINLALAEGCEVFTTVGTLGKRQFIKRTFPRIRDDRIGNSRDTSFVRMIKDQTDGLGVDIVLNSLAGEKLLASVACLAWNGRFLEIGKFDLSADNSLGMQCFLRQVSFHGIMLDRLYAASERDKLDLKLCLDKYLKSGAIKPLARTVFTKDKIEDAFRYLSTGKHVGKVTIKMQDDNPSSSKLIAIPQYYCLENRSYILLGGLGGLGLEICDWLVIRGARNLVIASRSGITTNYQRMRVNLWRSYGAKIAIVSGRCASVYDDCQFIVDAAAKLAPVDGIFNLAVALQDALWENQTKEKFAESFKAKAWATKNLDVITRKVCPKLRHFVVFSSVVCGRGNAGQSNYAMSNSVMERICERRAAEGLPALAVQFGAVDDVGFLAETKKNNQQVVVAGTLPQSILSCLKSLHEFLLQSRPIVSSIVIAEKRATKGSLNVVDTVLNIMCLKDLKGINPNSTLADLGVDSMSSVEIRQILERELDVFLSEQQVRSLSFTKLKELASGNH